MAAPAAIAATLLFAVDSSKIELARAHRNPVHQNDGDLDGIAHSRLNQCNVVSTQSLASAVQHTKDVTATSKVSNVPEDASAGEQWRPLVQRWTS